MRGAPVEGWAARRGRRPQAGRRAGSRARPETRGWRAYRPTIHGVRAGRSGRRSFHGGRTAPDRAAPARRCQPPRRARPAPGRLASRGPWRRRCAQPPRRTSRGQRRCRRHPLRGELPLLPAKRNQHRPILVCNTHHSAGPLRQMAAEMSSDRAGRPRSLRNDLTAGGDVSSLALESPA